MGLSIAAGGVVGAASGALVTAFLVDFSPGEEVYREIAIWGYGVLGGILGLLAAALLLALGIGWRALLARLGYGQN